MASVASQLIEEVTAHAQSDSLEDAREIWADGTYFSNNLRICLSFSLPFELLTQMHSHVTKLQNINGRMYVTPKQRLPSVYD